MNLIGTAVKHKMFGHGTITTQDDTSISVVFAAKTAKFTYPDSNLFSKFLTAEDPAIQSAILQELADAQAVREAQKLAEEERKQREREKEAATIAPVRRTSARKKAPERQERIPGKPMTFYVFQGSTFDQESLGGYLWAPITNKAGSRNHHWDRLLDVRPGDIIFHGCDGAIKAISTARGECYDCPQPEELCTEDMWEREGRRVDCDYILIQNPVKTAQFLADILRLCANVKYAPFDRDGNGNMGYLFELDRRLARIFLRGTVACNDFLKDIGCIRALLAEEE